MKKLTAILLVLVMLLSLSAAALADEGAEDAASSDSEPKTMSFITALKLIRQNDWDGQLIKADGYDLSLWIPEQLKGQADMPDDCIMLFTDDKNECTVKLLRVGLDGAKSLEEVERSVTEMGGNSAGIYSINGFNVLVYQDEATDSLCAVILAEDGNALKLVMAPVSDKNYNSLLSTILCTVIPDPLHVSDAAEMMDADLNITWGEDKHVSCADDGSSITVNMWEKEVTADTVSEANNWDDVKQNKIDFYNIYADTLAIFGMDEDVELILNFTSPDEKTNFLTIDDGKLTYDVLAR